MNKKSTLLIILCALIISPFIFAIGDEKSVTSYEQAFQNFIAKARQSSETDYVIGPKELLTVKEFIKLAESHRIQRIEVYYSHWTDLRYGAYVSSEEGLRNKEFHSKSIIKDPFTDLSTIKRDKLWTATYFSTPKTTIPGNPKKYRRKASSG